MALGDYETVSTGTEVGTTGGEKTNAANDATKRQLGTTARDALIAIDILTRLVYWRNGRSNTISGFRHIRCSCRRNSFKFMTVGGSACGHSGGRRHR
jgi:hypothetical protein